MATDRPPGDPSRRDSASRPGLFSWVPIRSLAPRHRPRILAHLQQLDERDRYLRFGYAATDEQMANYVASIDFSRDEVFGIFDRRLRLIGLAHLAYMWPTRPDADNTLAEFGVSVLRRARGRGFGERLFDHAVLHARNRGVDRLLIHALTENAAMLQLARKAGAELHRDGSESQALLRLPPDTIASQVGALVEGGAAELDYGLKRQAQRLDRLLHALADRARG